MIIRKGSQYELYPHKIRYLQHGEEIEQWALPNKEWWVDFADKWEHTEIIEFIEIELTAEQLKRFEDVKNMQEDFTSQYIEYILDGTFSDDIPKTHPFTVARIVKNTEQLKLENALLKAQNQANADITEFHEEVLAEIILTIHS